MLNFLNPHGACYAKRDGGAIMDNIYNDTNNQQRKILEDTFFKKIEKSWIRIEHIGEIDKPIIPVILVCKDGPSRSEFRDDFITIIKITEEEFKEVIKLFFNYKAVEPKSIPTEFGSFMFVLNNNIEKIEFNMFRENSIKFIHEILGRIKNKEAQEILNNILRRIEIRGR
jgi:hypothetical protein